MEIVLIKKIGGNWHKIDVWENFVIGYKSGGIVIIDPETPRAEELYLPFYFFSDYIIAGDSLFIQNHQGEVFRLDLQVVKETRLLPALEKYPGYSFDENRTSEAIDAAGLKGLLEEVRVLDKDDRVTAAATMQKGIDFFQTETGEKIAHFDFPGYSFIDHIKLKGNRLYIADVFGLRILDVSDVRHPVLDDRFTACKGWPKDAALYKHYLLVADVLGIKIFDKQTDFALVGKIESNRNRVAKVVVHGNYAFLSCEAVGLKVADLSDIENPHLLSGIVLPKGIWDCAVYDNNAYLAAYTAGLLKVDCTDIKNLKQTGSYTGDEEVIGVHVTGRAVYAACSYNGFKIFDHCLNVIAEVKGIEGRCWTILEKDGYVLIAAGKSGVLIYDVSVLEDPIPVNRVKTVEARDLIIHERRLYIADGSNGALVYDISDIRKIKYMMKLPSAAFTRGIMADEAFIYKTDGDGGVEVYERM